jgi:cardiolipin synthase
VLPDLGYLEGNRLALLRNGEQYFPALIEAIDAAAEEIFIEVYIFADDETGSLIADSLARAAARGVSTHLLVDGFGAHDFAPRFREMLARAGAEVLVFRPSIWPRALSRLRTSMRRMHRKLVSIDGRIAFAGGINIIDDYEKDAPRHPRYDYAVRIEGPLAARVRAETARMWWRVAWATIGRRWPGFRAITGRAPRRRNPAAGSGQGAQRAALVVRDTLRHRHDIERAYLTLIHEAKEEVLIANAYFFPSRRFMRALAQAARRGVRVVLLLQGRVEYVLQHYASRALYQPLLAGGIQIHEYHLALLHAKVAVFDGRVACVGSSNIDPFSLFFAREANVFVDDEGFAQELRAGLLDAMKRGSRSVPRRRWARLSFLLKARIWISYRIARILIAFFGFGRHL